MKNTALYFKVRSLKTFILLGLFIFSAKISTSQVTADAGLDQTICEGGSIIIGGAPTGAGANPPFSYSWSPATGLSNPTDANPVATPTVTTVYTVTVTDAFSTFTATDVVTVIVDPAPTVNAGVDQTICAGNLATLAGTLSGSATSVLWTSSGTGTFSLPTSLTGTYTPSSADIVAGSVVLTATTNDPPGVCSAVSDQMVLTITGISNLSVTISACFPNNTFTLSGSVAAVIMPASGTLTITANNGTTTFDTIINAPFGTLNNWSISNIPSNGAASTVSAIFSLTGCSSPVVNYNAQTSCACVAQIGTFTTSISGNSTTANVLCYGDTLTITNNGNFVPPNIANNPPGPTYDPGIGWLLFSCPPTYTVAPENEPCLLGILDYGVSYTSINDFSLIESFPAGTFTNNTIYFVPITFYSIVGGNYSYINTSVPCYEMGAAIAITYLPAMNIYGTANYSGGAFANGGNAVLYKHYPYNVSFDTIQTVPLDAAGSFLFDSIPTSDYIVKIFPDAAFPSVHSTYFGNELLWNNATVINHNCSHDTISITMLETGPLSGTGLISGTVTEGSGFNRLEGDPIPGIDVKLGRNPGGQLVASTETDASGTYTFTSVPFNDGAANGVSYTVYVDIPGLERDSSYVITLNLSNPTADSLDYLADSTTIYINENSSTGISNSDLAKENKFNVYPNPFKGITTISYTLNADSDVRLDVYNVLGIKIQSLVNTNQPKGEFKYTLDSNFSSGVYFVNLTVNGKTSTQRVIKMD